MLVPGVQGLELEGRDSATIWRCPNDLELELQASLQLLKTPPHPTPPTPTPLNLDPAVQFEPLSSRKEKAGDHRPDPAPGLTQETAKAPPVPAAFQRPSPMGPAPTKLPPGHGRTSDPSRGVGGRKGGREAVPALVTSQCQMQIERRHGLPGMRQPIGRRECSPGRRWRRQTKTGSWGHGACPRAPGAPWPKQVWTHLGAGAERRAR